MSLKKKIAEDLIRAMKAKEQDLVLVLKSLKNAIKNKEIDLRRELNDSELLKTLFAEAKKRKDSIVQFKKANRPDLINREEKELKIIQKYLPEMLSKEEIKKIIYDIIKTETIERKMTNFGQVMKLSMQKLAGQAEGDVVSEVVKEVLSLE